MTSTAPEQSEEPEDMPEEQSSQRIDKWLWAARFFKTRGLAAAAVSGGKVHLDEQRIKPSRKIRPGDCLSIRRGDTQWCLQVKALNAQRRPASEAASLYLETEAGLAQRAQDAEQRRAQSPCPHPPPWPPRQTRSEGIDSLETGPDKRRLRCFVAAKGPN